MPTANENQEKISNPSFLGLESYSESQTGSFFGRDEEIGRLTTMIQLNTLTIVFGRSGTGKTSLLNAGVFPRLRKNYCLPFRIRLEYGNDSTDLISQIKTKLRSEIDKYGFKVESYPGDETLWEYFHKEPLWKTVTPILVFDQFEELFTLAKSNPKWNSLATEPFWTEMSDLIENNIPDKLEEKFLEKKETIPYRYKKQTAKFVFAFREEYLAEFETISQKIPSIRQSRFRLMPMNGHQAYEVITKTWDEKIKPVEAKKIVTYLTNEADTESYDLINIEPSLLSQVCAFIEKERRNSGSAIISAALLNSYQKEKILRSIYEEATASANAALPPIQDKERTSANDIKIFLEEKLITADGFRTKHNLSGADIFILPAVDVLKGRYFLREDNGTIELTHDVLAPIIKVDREKTRNEAAVATIRKRTRKIALIILSLLALAALATYYFVVLESEKAKKAIEKESIQLAAKIKRDSIRLNTISDSLKSEFKKYEALVNSLDPNDPRRKTIDSLKKVIDSLGNEFANTKIEIERDFENQVSEMQANPRAIRLPKPVFDIETDPQYIALKYSYDSLLRRHRELEILFDDYIRRIPDPTPIDKPELNFDTTNSLRIRLFYSNKYNTKLNPPDNLTVYMIPDNAKNKRIIRKAKIYEINCEENKINKAENIKRAFYRNGFYYFPDVTKGKYLVKICTYYGGYYTYNKSTDGMESVNWDASPPIR